MLTKPPVSDSKKADRHSPTLAALQCAYQLMQQRIISDPKSMIGILLYGTEASKFHGEEENSRGSLSYPHCYLLTDLNIPEADDVKALKKIVEDDEAAIDVLKPSGERVTMSNVLFCANQIFTTRAPNFTSRRLFIVTDNDDPHSVDKALRSSAAVRAKDLYDLGVIIELFPISSDAHAFDTKLFYDDIIYRASPSDPNAPTYNPAAIGSSDLQEHKTGSTDGITLLQSLLSSIASKSTPQRTQFSSVPFELAPNFRISVKGYLLFKHQVPARSCYVYLSSDRPLIAKVSTIQQADDTAHTIEKIEIRKAYKFGGEQIPFTLDEIKELRNFGEPIIRLIGFKPLVSLPLWANTRHSTFLYPSEDDFVGSTRVFSALFQSLLAKKKYALVWFIARRNAAPVLAAVMPSLPTSEESPYYSTARLTGVSPTGMPQGLYLVPLPFADDIRSNPPFPQETPLRAPDSLTDLMRPIISSLQLPGGKYEPSKYPNPSLQWHYRILQALALDEDLPEKPDDKTVPRYRQIDKRVGSMVTEWGNELEKVAAELSRNDHSKGGSVLSKRPGSSDGAAKKKAKTEDGGGGALDEGAMRKLWEKNKLTGLTVSQLKEFAGSKKIQVTGKKADIVERIEQWFESR